MHWIAPLQYRFTGIMLRTALLILPTAPLAMAGEEPRFGYYGGLDYQFVRIEAEYDDYKVNALTFIGGTELSDHWAVEAYFGIGMGEDSKTTTRNCVEESFELDNLLGVQLKGHAPLNDRFSIWASFGMSQTSVSSTIRNGCPFLVTEAGTEVDASETDLSVGVGADLRITADSSLIMGFTQYYDDGAAGDDLTVRSLFVGYRVHF